MKNEFFAIHTLNGHELKDYISAVKKLASDIGIVLVEDSDNDKVVAIFDNLDKITVMEGMYDFDGCWMSRWYEAQHNNLPERLVKYAVTRKTAGKKRIRLAKREFDLRFPQVFDKWRYDLDKGITPDGWVSIV